MKNIFRAAVAFTISLLVLCVGTASAELVIDHNYQLVSSTRVGRTAYDYTYQVNIINNGSDVQNVTATVISSSPHTTIIDGDVNFGNVAGGGIVTSADTFTLRQNRRYSFDPSALMWGINYEEASRVIGVKSSLIDAENGGTITVSGSESPFSKNFEIHIPPGALDQDTVIAIGDVVANIPKPPVNKQFITLPINLEPHGLTFSVPVTVKIPYTTEDLIEAEILTPDDISLYYFDTQQNSWIEIPIKEINSNDMYIVAEITHFSKYGLFSKIRNLFDKDPASMKKMVDYVKNVWEISASTKTIENIIGTYKDPGSSIGFNSLLGGLLTATSVSLSAQEGDYARAAKTASEYLIPLSLEQCGYYFLSGWTILGTTTYKFFDLLANRFNNGAFNAQIRYWIYYRNVLKWSPQDIINLNGPGEWLIDPEHQLGTYAPIKGWTPEDVYEIGEQYYQLRYGEDTGDSHKPGNEAIIKAAFVKAMGSYQAGGLPVAYFTIAPEANGNAPFSPTFDPTGSFAVNGATIVEYQWDFGDGQSITKAAPEIITYEYAEPGKYSLTLTVTDNNGKSSSIIKEINVTSRPEINISPFADFSTTVDPDNNLLVSFNATNSHDPDGNIISYQWRFGDGDVGSGVQTTHLYGNDGTYLVTLTVYDDKLGEGVQKKKVSNYAPDKWSNPWTWVYPLPQGNCLAGIWGSSEDEVIMVGAGGTILRYDHGLWNHEESPTKRLLIDVWGSGDNDVYAVGADGIIIHFDGTCWSSVENGAFDYVKTMNSFINWDIAGSGYFFTWHNVSGSSPNNVYVIGNCHTTAMKMGIVAHFDGTSWDLVNTNLPPLSALWVADEANVFTTVGQHYIYRYDGNTWARQDVGDAYYYYIWGIGSNDAYALGGRSGYSYLAHYDGSQWTEERLDFIPTGKIWGTSSDDLYILASPGIYHYDGVSWSKVSSFPADFLGVNDLHFFSTNNIYAINSWDIAHYNGADWKKLNQRDVSIGIAFNSVWPVADDNIYSVGGHLFHYDGLVWQNLDPSDLIHENLTAVSGADSSSIYAVGTHGTIIKIDGLAWEKLESGTSSSLTDISVLNDNDICVVGSDNTVLRYDGSEWRNIFIPGDGTNYDFTSVWRSHSDKIYAVRHGNLLHYDGDNWHTLLSKQRYPYPGVLVGSIFSQVWGASDTDIFVIGRKRYSNDVTGTYSNGIIFHYDGEHWSSTEMLAAFPTAIWGNSATDVYMAVNTDVLPLEKVYHYDGISWTPMDSVNTNIRDISGVGGDIFAVGFQGGGLLKLHVPE